MSEDPRSAVRDVRTEDAFDAGAVAAWLARHTGDPALGTTPTVRQFPGGASNLTYLLTYPDRELILRRPPRGTKAGGAHDMGREYRIQQALGPFLASVPRMVGHCDDAGVIGSEFYVMERLVGPIPRQELPAGLLQTPEEVRSLCLNAVDLLVELHGVDTEEAGLDGLSKGDGYVARQVSGWSERFRRAKTWNVPSFEHVMTWLDANQPPDRGSVLVHNDFRLDNIVLDPDDPTRPIGLLDWEMATIGDPLMDLGGALAYWVQADDPWTARLFRRQPTHVEGMLTRAEVVQHYGERTGLEITPQQWAFYEVFGLFRLAVICQQIYYRYMRKETTNTAFRFFGLAVLLLERRCRRVIRRAA